MPHPKFGNVGFILGGGGCLEGLPQAVQTRAFLQAGIEPDYIGAVSVGACNAIDLRNSILIWERCITSPWKIYDLHPVLKRILDDAIKFIAPFKRHKNWHDWRRDFKSQRQNIMYVLAFLKRTGHTFLEVVRSFPREETLGSDNLFPFGELVFTHLHTQGIGELRSIFDINPLMQILKSGKGLETTLLNTAPLHIFVRALETRSEHVLTPKTPDELILAIQAATALVPFFEPVKIGESYFCDVGTVNPFPAEHAFDAGCDTVFAFVKNYDRIPPTPVHILDRWAKETEIHTGNVFKLFYEKARARADKEQKHLYLIMPQPPHPDLRFLGISPEAIRYTIATETLAMENKLDSLLR